MKTFNDYKPNRLEIGLPADASSFDTLIIEKNGDIAHNDYSRNNPYGRPWNCAGWYTDYYDARFCSCLFLPDGVYWCYHKELDEWYRMSIDAESRKADGVWFNDEIYHPAYIIEVPESSVLSEESALGNMDVKHEI